MCAGCGEGAGGADRDEAGDGAVHEDAGERRLREAGRSGGAQTAAGRPSCHQPTANAQVTGEAVLLMSDYEDTAFKRLTSTFVSQGFTRRFQLFPETCRCLISLLALCEMMKHHFLSRITCSQQ